MQLTLTVITYSHLFPPPHLIDYSPIICRPFSHRLLLTFVVACCPFLSSFAARICPHLPLFLSFLFVVLFCHRSLSASVVPHAFFCCPQSSPAACIRHPSLTFVVAVCRSLIDKICMLAMQRKGQRSTVGGGIHRQKKRLPSPLPKPSANGFAYDATSRRIEIEREHVRLRQWQTHGG